MSLEKKHTLWDGLCRIVQSVFLAAEITVLADLLFAAGEKPLPRAAFWGLFLAAAAALSLWRGFTRKGRRIVFLSIAGAAVLSALALFAAWSAAAPKTAYEAPETEPKAIFSEKRVLAVVPHEDDDLNLLSGVTGQFTDAGSEVYVVFVSTGDAAGLGEKRAVAERADGDARRAEPQSVPRRDAVYARKPARRSAQRDRGDPRRRDLLRGL